VVSAAQLPSDKPITTTPVHKPSLPDTPLPPTKVTARKPRAAATRHH
jgi:hypothetical protein